LVPSSLRLEFIAGAAAALVPNTTASAKTTIAGLTTVSNCILPLLDKTRFVARQVADVSASRVLEV